MKFLFHYLKAIATLNLNTDGRLSTILGKLETGDLFEVNQASLIIRLRVISIF
ncbi:hypothetical protein [Nostoc sp.]|uniref:hypothetical protein n=1 Tax=Nostoc sp. TaxID=1180 RepID=UPI002FFB6E77